MFANFSARRIQTPAGLIVSSALSSLVVHGRNPPEPGFPAGIRLAGKARGEAAIAELGGRPPDASGIFMGDATLAAGSFCETAGRPAITGTANLRPDAGSVPAFASSATVDWSGRTLHLAENSVSGSSLRSGTNSSSRAPGQLALISEDGFSNFTLNANGYLTASAVTGPRPARHLRISSDHRHAHPVGGADSTRLRDGRPCGANDKFTT